MKKQFIISSLALLCALQISAQKNAFSVYYNQNLNGEYSKIGAIGGRYSRSVMPRLSIALGADYENPSEFRGGSSGIEIQDLQTGTVLFKKSVFLDHAVKINTYTLDALIYYNLFNPDSRFSLCPFLGVSQRIFDYSHKPLIEIVNYEIVSQETVKDTKYYTLPKAGVAFSFQLTKHLNVGAELFYRSNKDNHIDLMTNASTLLNIEGTTIYDDQGRSTVLTSGSGSSYGVYTYYEQAGASLNIAYRF